MKLNDTITKEHFIELIKESYLEVKSNMGIRMKKKDFDKTVYDINHKSPVIIAPFNPYPINPHTPKTYRVTEAQLAKILEILIKRKG